MNWSFQTALNGVPFFSLHTDTHTIHLKVYNKRKVFYAVYDNRLSRTEVVFSGKSSWKKAEETLKYIVKGYPEDD